MFQRIKLLHFAAYATKTEVENLYYKKLFMYSAIYWKASKIGVVISRRLSILSQEALIVEKLPEVSERPTSTTLSNRTDGHTVLPHNQSSIFGESKSQRPPAKCSRAARRRHSLVSAPLLLLLSWSSELSGARNAEIKHASDVLSPDGRVYWVHVEPPVITDSQQLHADPVRTTQRIEPCADVLVSAAARRSILVGGGSPPVPKTRRGVGDQKNFFQRVQNFCSIL